MKACKLLAIESGRVFNSRDVKFHETIFSFSTKSPTHDTLDLFHDKGLPMPIPDSIYISIPSSDNSGSDVFPPNVQTWSQRVVRKP